jgi:hypothetical protein
MSRNFEVMSVIFHLMGVYMNSNEAHDNCQILLTSLYVVLIQSY